MSQSQRKLLIAFGIVDLIIVIVLLGVILSGRSNLPITIPVLLVIPAVVFILLGLRK